MNHRPPPLSPRNGLGSLQTSPNSNTYSNLFFPSVPQVGAAEGHANAMGADNARLGDFNVSLCEPSPSSLPELDFLTASESAITTPDTSPLFNSFQNPDMSIAESAQITPSTHASDQVNPTIFPYPVKYTNIPSYLDITTQSNQPIACFPPISDTYKKIYSYKNMLIEGLISGKELSFLELSQTIYKKHPEIATTPSWRRGLRTALTRSRDNNANTLFETVLPSLTNMPIRPLWRMKEGAIKDLISLIKENDEKIKNQSAQPFRCTLPKTKSFLPSISKGNESSQTAQSSKSTSTTLDESLFLYFSSLANHAHKQSYKNMLIHCLRNKKSLSIIEIYANIKKENPEVTQHSSWKNSLRRILSTHSLFEPTPMHAMYNLQPKRWRLSESEGMHLTSQIEINDENIKYKSSKKLRPVLISRIGSCLPPISRENGPSQTVQLSESASAAFGASPLSTPLKKHDISIAESAQVTPSPYAFDQINPTSFPYQVDDSNISSDSDTSRTSQTTIIYSSAVPAHSVEYSRKNLIIECLQNGEELSSVDINRAIKKNHPELEQLNLLSTLWQQSIRNTLTVMDAFERSPHHDMLNSGRSLWRIKKSVLENMPYPIVIHAEEITYKNTKSLNVILPEPDSIISTIKPQTAQLSEMESDNPFSRKRLRDIEQDGATRDNNGEQQAKELRIQTLTPANSSATGCLDDGEKLTHQEQEYDQNINDSYWTAENIEALQSTWDTIMTMEINEIFKK